MRGPNDGVLETVTIDGLRLIVKGCPAGTAPYDWERFALDDAFDESWWNGFQIDLEGVRFVEVHDGADEVARVELDDDVALDYYQPRGLSGQPILEIQLIEVALTHRRRGTGSLVVGALTRHFSDYQLVALSEEADEFWASLGWTRFLHTEHGERARPLFVAPMETPAPNTKTAP